MGEDKTVAFWVHLVKALSYLEQLLLVPRVAEGEERMVVKGDMEKVQQEEQQKQEKEEEDNDAQRRKESQPLVVRDTVIEVLLVLGNLFSFSLQTVLSLKTKLDF